MKVYKVTTRHGLSVNTPRLLHPKGVLDHPVYLTYRVGRIVRPRLKGSKLFVFRYLKDAKAFVRGHAEQRIFVCEAKGVEKMPLRAVVSRDLIEKFWLTPNNLGSNDTAYAPRGTYGADSLKVISEKKGWNK
jgi:hypothetical protein